MAPIFHTTQGQWLSVDQSLTVMSTLFLVDSPLYQPPFGASTNHFADTTKLPCYTCRTSLQRVILWELVGCSPPSLLSTSSTRIISVQRIGKAHKETLIFGGVRPRSAKVPNAATSGLRLLTSPPYPGVLTLLDPLPHASRRWRHFKSGNVMDSKTLYGSPSYRIAIMRDPPQFTAVIDGLPIFEYAMADLGLNDTMGVTFIGMVFDAILYGIMTFQTYRFYNNDTSDRLALRLLVGFLWVLETLQVALIVHVLYYFLILHYGEPDVLAVTVWSLNVESGVTVVITFIVRTFFTVRLWRISGKNKLLVVAVMVFSLAQLGLGLAMCALTFIIVRFDQLPKYIVPLTIQLGISVAADVAISGPLVYYLNKNRSGFRRTNSLINRLIKWSINTALITGVFELLQMLTWVTKSHTLIFLGFHLVVGKLYTNSMLAMLNGRKSLRSDFGSQAMQTSMLVISPVDGSTGQETEIMLNSQFSFPPRSANPRKPSLAHLDTGSYVARNSASMPPILNQRRTTMSIGSPTLPPSFRTHSRNVSFHDYDAPESAKLRHSQVPWATDEHTYPPEKDEEMMGSDGIRVWRRQSGVLVRDEDIHVERMEVVVPPADVVEEELAQLHSVVAV